MKTGRCLTPDSLTVGFCTLVGGLKGEKKKRFAKALDLWSLATEETQK